MPLPLTPCRWSVTKTLPPSIKAAAGIKAFYFRDPDEHNLEVIYFPPGKGDPRWQEKTDKLFLGVDHTAIGISNTEVSLKFYLDLIGLRKVGESENFGTEQEHLNQVFGAHLLITAMRPASGPGIVRHGLAASLRRIGRGDRRLVRPGEDRRLNLTHLR